MNFPRCARALVFMLGASSLMSGCGRSHQADGDVLLDTGLADGGRVDSGFSDAGARDGGIEDAGWWCECPPPPPGCDYVGAPCPCFRLECRDGGFPRVCGGFAGFTCTSDEFCDYTDPHLCGAADETGICTPRPTACPPIFGEVCGCDGAVYPSECDAHAAGVDVFPRDRTGCAL